MINKAKMNRKAEAIGGSERNGGKGPTGSPDNYDGTANTNAGTTEMPAPRSTAQIVEY